MVAAVKRKLNNQNGITLLVALVGMLAATMVSAVVIAAAQTTMKRSYSNRTAEQAHQTLTSAAMLLRDEIMDTEVKYIETSGTENSSDIQVLGELGYDMKHAIEMADAQPGDAGWACERDGNEYPITLSDAAATVDVEYTIKPDYTIIFTLTINESPDGETVYLTVEGVENESTSTSGTEPDITTTWIRTVSWRSPKISGIAGE